VALAEGPSAWLAAFGSALLALLAAPFQMAFYLCGWIGAALSSFATQVQEPLFPSAQMVLNF